jgi:hypothetical protein
MKKILPGLFALLLAIGFSAFSPKAKQITKGSDDVYNWFNSSDNSYLTSTGSSASPNSCTANGDNCVKGFLSTQVNTTYPGGTPTISYARNP